MMIDYRRRATLLRAATHARHMMRCCARARANSPRYYLLLRKVSCIPMIMILINAIKITPLLRHLLFIFMRHYY